MMESLLTAGQRLTDALLAENGALAALDLPCAAGLATAKMQAADAFAAAFATMRKLGIRVEGPYRQRAADLTDRLQQLTEDNRRLLERAISIQSRVIETIAGAALPRQGGSAYGAAGRPLGGRQPPALAMATRA
jgi:hypothetical protein